MEKEEFIKELKDWINKNSRLSDNGDYVVSKKWLMQFIDKYN